MTRFAPFLPALFLPALFLPTVVSASEPSVRVEVFSEIPSVRVTVLGPCHVIAGSERRLMKAVEALRWQEVRPSPTGLRVGQMALATDRVQILPRESPILYVNGTRYRGGILVVRLDAHRLRVVNVMPMEEYLKGVVPSEVDYRWPPETLKAQAIIARTFTYRQLADRAAHDFDVTRTWPQLYGGLPSERGRAGAAVEATNGLVLTFHGTLVPTYYHTVCGGRTEDAAQVWPGVDLPPLRSVECPYCQRAPHYHWTLTVSAEELRQALQQQGTSVGSLTAITLGPKDRSGRVTSVTLASDQATITIPALQFRAALGANRLRSTNFTVVHSPGNRDWRFKGYGWGHGVGLCQWGAATLGRRQWTAAQILQYYYPGAEVTSWPAT